MSYSKAKDKSKKEKQQTISDKRQKYHYSNILLFHNFNN